MNINQIYNKQIQMDKTKKKNGDIFNEEEEDKEEEQEKMK